MYKRRRLAEDYETPRTWFKDPAVKFDFKKGGCPPPNHPRRCQSPNKQRSQCGHWSEPGRDYCKHHGGRSVLFRQKDMSAFYSKHAASRLKDLLKQAEESGNERMVLDEEIDLSRILALRSIQLFEAACLDESNSQKTSTDIKAAAIAGARNAMSHVADLVMRAAKIRALDANSAIAPAVDLVVQQMVKAVEQEVATVDKDLADRLIARLNDIHLPTSEADSRVVVIT